MSGDFIDSNVFVYLFDETDDRKYAIAHRLIDSALESGGASISFQVVQETLNVLTRKLPAPMSRDDAGLFMERTLLPFWRVMPSAYLYRRGLMLQDRYRYGFYDSLIIAAAQEAGCKRLYSEDLQHAQRIERLTIMNPFVETPD